MARLPKELGRRRGGGARLSAALGLDVPSSAEWADLESKLGAIERFFQGFLSFPFLTMSLSVTLVLQCL